MSYKLSILLILLLLVGPDGGDDGRRGNAHYDRQEYAEAAEAYRSGLNEAEGKTRYGLLNNLGAALHRMREFDPARKAFDEAIAAAPSTEALSRTAYNAGNNAYAMKQSEQALEYYRRALLANPENEDARFNYEFVRRQLEEQQQQQPGSDSGEGRPQPEDQGEQQSEGDPEQPEDSEGEEEQEAPGESEPQEGDQPGQTGREPDPERLSREQAEQILEALEREEQELLREAQRQRTRPRRIEKDW